MCKCINLFYFVLSCSIYATSIGFHLCHIGLRPLGPKEIDGLLVPPGKPSLLLTDHLITG